ncbi:hypothetical protein MVEN_01771700 [Mycena venus]|uniref:Uncharacterized protein n=1 Tax=Mycena venus TaxID=2733690 RepID=A0A8H7CQ39_9AGAR|nr:hypothetical protein MVEN_01771700 [Mycena venus]
MSTGMRHRRDRSISTATPAGIWIRDDDNVGSVPRTLFPSVVLHTTLTVCICSADSPLLPGVGPLVVFEIFNTQQVELRDDHRRIRRLQCWNDNDTVTFKVDYVCEHLAVHYGLHKTVGEIRISRWDIYAEVFERHPPQPQDGVTLSLSVDWAIDHPIPTDDEGNNTHGPTKMLRLPGLARVEFFGGSPYLFLGDVLDILAHIEA